MLEKHFAMIPRSPRQLFDTTCRDDDARANVLMGRSGAHS